MSLTGGSEGCPTTLSFVGRFEVYGKRTVFVPYITVLVPIKNSETHRAQERHDLTLLGASHLRDLLDASVDCVVFDLIIWH